LTEVYVSVDIEALGKHPESYPLASIGACVVGDLSKTFYVELKPDKLESDEEAVRVCGFTLNYLQTYGMNPKLAMQKFANWLKKLKGKPIFVGFPLGFDRMWVYTYFKKYGIEDPFGRTCNGIDIKTVAMIKLGIPYTDTTKRKLRDILGAWGGQHTHNALDDAKEQALLFERLMQYR
jgi:DNA polymerase III epsilon subunit-like protein